MSAVTAARLARALSLALLLVLLFFAAAHAQQDTTTISVTGVVGDAQSGAPIANAVVSIPDLGIRTVSDEKGRFALSGVPRGEHRWLFRMLGYADWEEPLDLADGEFLRVGLLPQPIALQNITVTVDRLEQRRKAAGRSVHTLGWDEMRSAVGSSAADVVRHRSPSAAIPCPTPNTAAPAIGQILPMGGANADIGYCIRWRGRVISPVIYLDDELTAVPIEILAAFPPQDIHSIEFFSHGSHVRVYTIDFMKKGRPLLPPGVIFRRGH